MKVECDVSYVELEGDYGPIDGIEVTCGECGNTTESFGTSERSIRRCLVLMREECPSGAGNYYMADE